MEYVRPIRSVQLHSVHSVPAWSTFGPCMEYQSINQSVSPPGRFQAYGRRLTDSLRIWGRRVTWQRMASHHMQLLAAIHIHIKIGTFEFPLQNANLKSLKTTFFAGPGWGWVAVPRVRRIESTKCFVQSLGQISRRMKQCFLFIYFFCGNVSRLDHVDQVNFAYLNSELSRKKKREAEGDAREIKFSQMGWVLCSTNWFWHRDSHLWDEVWRLRACRANMWWSVVVFESDVMDMLMSVKDLPNTCQGLNHRFFTWLQHLLIFWSSDVEQLCAAVAKSTFGSENAQNTTFREHFWKFWCRKNARRCGERRILKWKCTKHGSFGPLFKHLTRQNCAPLWRKVLLEVKMHKTRQFWSTFLTSDAPKLHAPVAKSTFWSQNVQNTSAADSFLKFWCRKISRVES